MKTKNLFSILTILLLVLVVGCTNKTQDNDAKTNKEDYSNPIVNENLTATKTNRGLIIEMRNETVVKIGSVEYKDTLTLFNVVGNPYNVKPPEGEKYRYVLISVDFKNEGTEKIDLDLRPKELKDNFKLYTKEGAIPYQRMCYDTVKDEPKLNCQYSGGSQLTLQPGDVYEVKLLFSIPKSETLERISYFHYTNETTYYFGTIG